MRELSIRDLRATSRTAHGKCARTAREFRRSRPRRPCRSRRASSAAPSLPIRFRVYGPAGTPPAVSAKLLDRMGTRAHPRHARAGRRRTRSTCRSRAWRPGLCGRGDGESGERDDGIAFRVTYQATFSSACRNVGSPSRDRLSSIFAFAPAAPHHEFSEGMLRQVLGRSSAQASRVRVAWPRARRRRSRRLRKSTSCAREAPSTSPNARVILRSSRRKSSVPTACRAGSAPTRSPTP